MPLIRRIPKRGFNNVSHGTRLSGVNVGRLNVFENGAVVDEASLRSIGLVNGKSDGVKILGGGEITKRLHIKVAAYSVSAQAKIAAAGGQCEVV